MMKISKDNYELYLARYLEGQLDPVITAELMLFLSENPDLEMPFDKSDNLLLKPDKDNFPNKNMLKKDFGDLDHIDESNFDEFCIASAEGLLDSFDEERFYRYIAQYPEKEKELATYRQLVLKPDPHLQFPFKSSLKKPIPLSPQYRILLLAASVAASIIFLLFIFTSNRGTTLSGEGVTSVNTVADTTDSPVISPVGLHDEISGHAESSGITVKTSYAETIDPQKSGNIPDAMLQVDSAIKKKEPDDLPLMDPVRTIYLASTGQTTKTIRETTLTDRKDSGFSRTPGLSQEEAGSSGSRLIDYIRDLDMWETAHIAVQGFNLLTESSLSIEKISDEQGRIKQIVIDTEERTLLTAGIKNPDL